MNGETGAAKFKKPTPISQQYPRTKLSCARCICRPHLERLLTAQKVADLGVVPTVDPSRTDGSLKDVAP